MTDKTLTSSGFYLSQEAPIHSDNPVPTPQASPPDILRCAYMELVVTDLAASRVFYVDVLGLVEELVREAQRVGDAHRVADAVHEAFRTTLDAASELLIEGDRPVEVLR